MMSKRPGANASRPSCPFSAKVTSASINSSTMPTIRRLLGLSSTTSTRRPTSWSGAGVFSTRASVPCSRRTRTVASKVEPWPGVERQVMVPPINAAREREMVSPRPAPPYCRVMESSPCSKRLKSRAPRSGVNPQPVSLTRKVTCVASSSSSAMTSSLTSPASVNLTALLSRLARIWRTRRLSPSNRPFAPGLIFDVKASPLASALAAKRSIMAETASSSWKGSRSISR